MNELNQKYKVSKTIFNFISEHNELTPLRRQVAQVLEETYKAQNLRGMRHIYKDFKEWALDLNKDQLSELNQILKDQFDESLT